MHTTDPVKIPAKSLRIVYMGTPEFAVEPLRRLVEEGYHVVCVVTMPDKPAGRGLKTQESAVKKYAIGAGLRVLQPERLKDPAFIDTMRSLEPDLGIVIAFRMLPEIVWQMPRLGTFNLHASLLPQYRGAAPINRAIINGETVTGVTTFMLNSEIDQGDILGRREVAILPEDNAGSLHDKLMAVGTELVVETVENIAAQRVNPIAQTADRDMPLREAPKIFKDDCRIDWSRDVSVVNNLIRGLSPYPAAWTLLDTGNAEPIGVKIFSASRISSDACAVEDDGANPVEGKTTYMSENMSSATHPFEDTLSVFGVPGTILTDGKSYLRVVCGSGMLRIDELQPAGKRRMTVAEWLRGFALDPKIMRFV